MSHTLAGLAPRRRLLGFTAAEIAQRVGMSENGYSRLERGQRRIYFDKAIAISRFTGINLEDLIREPTEAERVELFKAGEAKRALQDASGGDEALAGELSGWADDEPGAQEAHA